MFQGRRCQSSCVKIKREVAENKSLGPKPKSARSDQRLLRMTGRKIGFPIGMRFNLDHQFVSIRSKAFLVSQEMGRRNFGGEACASEILLIIRSIRVSRRPLAVEAHGWCRSADSSRPTRAVKQCTNSSSQCHLFTTGHPTRSKSSMLRGRTSKAEATHVDLLFFRSTLSQADYVK